MPFGLTNTLVLFVDHTYRIFHFQLNRFVLEFINDISMYSKSESDHEAHLSFADIETTQIKCEAFQVSFLEV